MRRWAYPGLAFLTGSAVTIFEFAAPSLFRAHFGQTVHVWANVIGVILGALALGYVLGGRWADRTTSILPLVSVLAFAGIYGLVVAWLGPGVSRWLAGSEEYTQDTALRAFFMQSLAASLILFGPPLIALGMATPLLVQRASAQWPVGRATGLVFGVGTVGSIVGIYLTTFLFVPAIGVRATIAVSSGALLALAVGGLLLGGKRRAAAALLLGFGLLPLGTTPAWDKLPPDGARLIYYDESPYQLIRVVDRPPQRDGKVHRWLAFDEGMGTYHSMQVDRENPWTGAYYDAFAHLPEWLGKDELRICILGNAAGTMGDLLSIHNPGVRFLIDGVEIDPAVTKAARETMGLKEDEHMRVFHADGRTFLRGRPEGAYDAIILDAYARQVSIPAALATKEFFQLAKSRLREGGVVFINLGALRPGGLLVDTLCDTVAAGFESDVFRAPLHNQDNVLIIAARGGPPPAPPSKVPLLVPASYAKHIAGNHVLTDDFCPVESLTAKDLLLK